MFDSMASHRENSQVHQESAPRAPVVPQHATGMRNNNGNEQRQIGLTSGVIGLTSGVIGLTNLI